jgi:Zinc knuckle
MRCFDCGQDGHIAANCTNREIDSSGKPPWCGICDETTRLIDAGDLAARCQQCHPQRNRQLPQHRKCPSCHMTVHKWDNGECGKHSSPAIAGQRPDRAHVEAIVAANCGAAG